MIGNIHATVLFVRDLAGCAAFYRDTLGFAVAHTDDNSVWFQDQQVLLLQRLAAEQLVGEDTLSAPAEGSPRVLLCAEVEDVDEAHAALAARGVSFVRPPTSQPWGLRTAHFADPEGNLWEIAHNIAARAEKLEAAAKR
jgi:catechol 2,3-dioxygenase-like lactoylglutathione lyase family enzyme